ncbi:hypothetical protein A11A3_07028 [Alcanivorax hongdengensis A-11-3]|uniref:DUF4340 domain-containing protein n=1 Tax=Alcanivorax hongdengensis A-11-3 TaxID=1177179 RepID=L0WCR9_9GAMM|nr:DUF4340 domain-containing protein [Alcanivorax hongdengensis]EKF74756.1 hypothetical protein A11A3_07028 [Alcanivorax hongdengensis A-11-3]
MRKFNATLWGLLIVQVILVGLAFGGLGSRKAGADGPYITLDPASLTSLTLTGSKGKSLTLAHQDGHWQVPDKWDFPVDADKIQRLINGLNSARPDLPVAVSNDARQRFHVASDKFERHLVFKTAKGTALDLYLGSNAGANRVYARLAGQGAIQALTLPLWQAGLQAEDWLDRNYLKPALANQRRITLPGVTLTRDNQQWQVADLAAGKQSNPGKVQGLLDHLSSLQWQTLEGRTDTVSLPAQATFTVTLTPKDGKAVAWRFYQDTLNSGKPRWRLSRSDSPYVFTVAVQDVTPLRDASTDGLSQDKPVEDSGKGDQAATAPTAGLGKGK